MLTIVFYGNDGKAAKARGRQLAVKPNTARVYDAMTWSGQVDPCDAVEIMPCVPSWKRRSIEDAYAEKVVSADNIVETYYRDGDTGGGIGAPFAVGVDVAESDGMEAIIPIADPSKPFVTTLGDLPKRRGRPPGSKNKAA